MANAMLYILVYSEFDSDTICTEFLILHSHDLTIISTAGEQQLHYSILAAIPCPPILTICFKLLYRAIMNIYYGVSRSVRYRRTSCNAQWQQLYAWPERRHYYVRHILVIQKTSRIDSYCNRYIISIIITIMNKMK